MNSRSGSGTTFSRMPRAARESLPPENDAVTGLDFPLRKERMSLTAADSRADRWRRLASTNLRLPESGETGVPDGSARSLMRTAFSASRRESDDASAVPAPIFPPFLSMTGAPAEKPPDTSLMHEPGRDLPFRWPDIPENETTFDSAQGANSSAPACLRSRA